MDQKTTRELEEVLKNTKDADMLEDYLEELPTLQPYETFREYYKDIIKDKELDNTDLIQKSGIERTYYYQLMNGTRSPGRDKILLLCITAGFTLKETQRALEIANAGTLYSKNRRDAILIFCIERKLNMIDTNELLDQFGESLL